MLPFRSSLLALLTACALFGQTHGTRGAAPLEAVLIEAKSATAEAVSRWKEEGFKTAAVVLDERTTAAAYKDAAKRISEGGLELYYWIEVARNPEMAAKNPRWMAALGTHADWQKNFPNAPEPGIGEVAKAFPWVPISYVEAFDGHLARIDQLLKRIPSDWRGLLLNDLQGGPSSCGCGNLQCRWALDYHVPATATKLDSDDVAARFVAEVRRRVGNKTVIPVWTTECAEVDLPPDKNGGRPGTGFCGSVGCAHSACAIVFSRQWSALTLANDTPVALLATHTTLNRTRPEFGGGPSWATNAIGYVNRTLPAHGGKAVDPKFFWVVVEGGQTAAELEARQAAAKAGVGGVIVARVKIEQSYEPRIIKAK